MLELQLTKESALNISILDNLIKYLGDISVHLVLFHERFLGFLNHLEGNYGVRLDVNTGC